MCLKHTLIKRKDCDSYELLKRAKEMFDKSIQVSSNGNPFSCYLEEVEILYNPFVLNSNSWDLLSIIWDYILRNEKKECNDNAKGICDMYYVIRKVNKKLSNLVGTDFLPWAFAHYQKFPATDGLLYSPTELYMNSNDIKDIADKYLPVINLNSNIHESWNDVLHLRNILQLEDYLTILTNISHDEDNTEQNKERISKIYQRLVDLDCLTTPSKVEQIKEWAKSNNILSKDGTFKSPRDLSHITLDGFSPDNRVYIGSPSDRGKVIDLLSVMGVKVITEKNVKPSFKEKREM